MNLWKWLFREPHGGGLDEAQEALARAEAAKRDVERKEPEVDSLIRDLRIMRLENNFARNIRATVRGRHTA